MVMQVELKIHTTLLKALALITYNAYAKKGIAWIVFSMIKIRKRQLRILDSVTATYNAPDYFLLKAELPITWVMTILDWKILIATLPGTK